MHTILRVDLQAIRVVVVLHVLVDTRWAVAAFGACIGGQIDVHGHRRVFQGEVRGLVFFVVGVADEDAAQTIECDFTVRLGVVDGRVLRSRLKARVIGLVAVQSPRGRLNT